MKTVKDLGEFGIIGRIRRRIKHGKDVIQGIGDDTAVIRPSRGLELLTCDSLVEGVDFLWKKTPPRLAGRKLLAVNLSDIAAMGGIPRHALLSLGLFPELPLAWLDGFLDGLSHLAREFRVNLIGGDISRSSQFWASLALVGEVSPRQWVSRAGAKSGDQIFVTGTLGGSILGKHLAFTPRIWEARELTRRFRPTAMIDISDGFFQDLGHVLVESKVGAKVYASEIPISEAARKLAGKNHLSALDHALGDGEDFELIFTLSPRTARRLPSRILGTRLTWVGEILPRQKGFRVLKSVGEPEMINVSRKGYVHF